MGKANFRSLKDLGDCREVLKVLRLFKELIKGKTMKRTYITLLLAAVAMCTFADAPNGSGTYYQNADGKKGAALKTALRDIVQTKTELDYDYLWTAFRTTDKRSDGKVWDMYSNITNFTFGTDQAGNYQKEGDVYNREHSFPKSWFGGEIKPMYTDLHHMYPTDGYVNNRRDNYPFGEVSNPTYSSEGGFSKLGPCSYSGYTGTVFEPNDMYKGDFARTYFYMVTRYEEKLPDWYSNYSDSRATLDGKTYPGLKAWQLNMLMEWATNDPVSEKEINRNNAVAGIQGNRNPFIDYPGLEQYIWGTNTDDFDYDDYVIPEGYGSGDDPGPGPNPGTGTYKLQQVTSVEAGEMYVFEQSGYVMNNTCSSSSVLQTTNSYKTTGLTGTETYVWTLETATNGYYMKNANGTGNFPYLNNGSSTNVSFGTKSSIWAFNFQSDNTVLIQCTNNGNRFLGYTSASSHAYKAYATSNLNSYPHAIKVYKLVEEVTPSLTPSDLALTGAPVTLTFDLYNDSGAKTINYTTSSTGAVTVSESEYVTTSVSGNTITVTPVKVTPSAQTITVSQVADATYEAGSVTFTVTVGDSTPVGPTPSGKWVETPFADLTASDVFVIVGNNGNNYALPNDVTGSAPVATPVTVTGGKITSPVADNLKWNITSKAKGYTFYPNGSTTTWLYCTDSNNGLRVDDNVFNNVFVMGEDGYLQNVGTSRYVGIYNSQDWRCYTSTDVNIGGQTFKFYKYQVSIPVTVSELGCGTFASDYALDFSASEIRAFYATVSGNNLIFYEVEKVPANTGVLLYKVGGASDDIPVYNGTTDAVPGNAFVRGTGAAVSYSETDKNYILFDGDEGLGFYKANNNTVATNRAYIQVPASTNVKCFLLDLENDPTGIESIQNSKFKIQNEDAIYNLAGQRLSKMQKGINIVNGKKVLR